MNDMTEYTFQEVEVIRQKVSKILEQTVQDKKEITSLYSSVDPKSDARITAFSKLIDVFRSTELSFIFMSKYLMDKIWWHYVCQKPIDPTTPQTYIKGFDRFIKFGLVHGTFSCVESSIRVFIRALDPASCKGGLDNFKNIYKCLLRSKLSKPRPDYVELLHLFRLVRNTIHNNGVHFSKSGKDETITWKETRYEFKQGELVRGITWDFLLDTSDDVRLFLRSIVEDCKMKAISGEISDPAGPYGK